MSIKVAMWDIDGVLADTSGLVVREFQKVGKLMNFGGYDDIKEWDWTSLLAPEGITLAELYEKYAEIDVLQGTPFEDTIRAMRVLHGLGVENHCVTGRPNHQYDRTLEWLEAHVGPHYHALHHVARGQKHEWAAQHNTIVTVEDNREEAIGLADVPGNHSILVWTHYNALGDRDQDIMRSNFWHIEREKVPHFVSLAHAYSNVGGTHREIPKAIN